MEVPRCTSARLLCEGAEIPIHALAVVGRSRVGAAAGQPLARGLLDHALRERRLETFESERQLAMQRLPAREVLFEGFRARRRRDHRLADRRGAGAASAGDNRLAQALVRFSGFLHLVRVLPLQLGETTGLRRLRRRVARTAVAVGCALLRRRISRGFLPADLLADLTLELGEPFAQLARA